METGFSSLEIILEPESNEGFRFTVKEKRTCLMVDS